MKVRRHIVLSGRVQGVGLRYRAMHLAQSLGVTGWVRNGWDGRVEMELQGTSDEIALMLSKLHEGRFIQIDNVESEEIPAVQESSFHIRG